VYVSRRPARQDDRQPALPPSLPPSLRTSSSLLLLALRAGVRDRPRSRIPSEGTPTLSRCVAISSVVCCRPRRGMMALREGGREGGEGMNNIRKTEESFDSVNKTLPTSLSPSLAPSLPRSLPRSLPPSLSLVAPVFALLQVMRLAHLLLLAPDGLQ